jgi:hypothetical protein
VLLVVSTALVMTRSTACIEPAGEAEKAVTAKSEALGPAVYGKVASMQEGVRPGSKVLEPTVYGGAASMREGVRPGMESGQCRKRVSECSMSEKEESN